MLSFGSCKFDSRGFVCCGVSRSHERRKGHEGVGERPTGRRAKPFTMKQKPRFQILHSHTIQLESVQYASGRGPNDIVQLNHDRRLLRWSGRRLEPLQFVLVGDTSLVPPRSLMTSVHIVSRRFDPIGSISMIALVFFFQIGGVGQSVHISCFAESLSGWLDRSAVQLAR